MNERLFKTLTLSLALVALAMACVALVKTHRETAPSLAVVDVKGVMEAKKLVLLAALRGHDRDMALLEKTIAASHALPGELDRALTRLADEHRVTLIDKSALVKGEGIPDLTAALYECMGVTAADAEAARQTISRSTFGK